MQVPARLARRKAAARGEPGRAWIADLPAIVAGCVERWALSLDEPFPHLSYNYAVPARRPDGTEVVLKVCFPDREFLTEAESLRLFAGRGIVRLLEVDLARGALLLERLVPGATLRTIADDAKATEIAAEVMARLRRPAPAEHPFPTVADWARAFARLRARFNGSSGPLPPGMVARAEDIYRELLADQGSPMLLHGDLHHANILTSQRADWLAIDPKGVVGEAAYEVGALMRNWLPDMLTRPDAGAIQARRLEILSERLDLDRARLRDWSFAQAVLSACWTIEDEGTGWEGAIACAELLDFRRTRAPGP